MDIDLLPFIRQYALKSGSYDIPYSSFMDAYRRMAKANQEKSGEYAAMLDKGEGKIVAQLYALAEAKKLFLLSSDTAILSILLPERFLEPVKQEYSKMLESPDIPFPDEDALKLSVPPAWIMPLNLDSDLASFMQRQELPDLPLCRLGFSQGLKAFLLPMDMLKEGLLEQAVLKVRLYLRKGSNMEFTRRKLQAAFQGKELYLKDALNLILTRPYDAVEEMRASKGDMTFPLWAYILANLKADIQKRGEKTPEDIAILQAAGVAENFNNYYKGLQQKGVEIETALRNFDQVVRKPPYAFRYEDMVAFSDQNGRPLLGRYSKEQFDDYLSGKTHAPDMTKLPEIVGFLGPQDRKHYCAKDRILILAMKLLGEARRDIRAQLTEEWYRVLGDYRSLDTMLNDDAYRRDLKARLKRCSPLLSSLIEDKLILLAYVEFKGAKEQGAELERLFDKGDLAPIDQLLSLPRKHLLTDVRILLPFWYSIGPIVSLMRFFRGLGAKKRRQAAEDASKAEAAKSAAETASEAKAQPMDRQKELREAAIRAEKSFLPEGYQSLEDYLVELENKWNGLINPEAKRNLSEDVNSLIRDYLRGVIRGIKGTGFTLERLEALADTLADSPSLVRIRNSQALRAYIVGYMIRIVRKAK